MIPLGVSALEPRMVPTSCWSTATFGDTSAALSRELSALGEHLDLCRLFAVQCGADMVRGFLAARFVTTVVLSVSVLAVIVALVV